MTSPFGAQKDGSSESSINLLLPRRAAADRGFVNAMSETRRTQYFVRYHLVGTSYHHPVVNRYSKKRVEREGPRGFLGLMPELFVVSSSILCPKSHRFYPLLSGEYIRRWRKRPRAPYAQRQKRRLHRCLTTNRNHDTSSYSR